MDPNIPRFGIGFQVVSLITSEVGHIEPVFGQLVDACQEVPGKEDGFFLRTQECVCGSRLIGG